jgi:type 2 lantibiotic biosynthesis protein LanM
MKDKNKERGCIVMSNMLAYATSVEERIALLELHYVEKPIEDNLSKWLSRKSLCTEELFELSLQERGISKENFNLAIKTFSEEDTEILLEESKRSAWYKKTMEIFEDERLYEETPGTIDFSFAFRPYIQYLKSEMEKIVTNDVSINDSEAFLLHLIEEFMQIASKTLVYDLHEQKKKNAFEGGTPDERFTCYMKRRFGDKVSILEFYEEYPVLFRLLTERTLFHIENYREFVQAIQKSLPDFKTMFSLISPYQVSDISLGAGDSHGKGKTVILFTMNGQRFAFKYKNLEIGERFNVFLSYLEKQTEMKFFKVKRIVGEDYCIEEFVPKQECKTEDEVKRFYRRFGEYVALAYLLCGNDFHYENLIAHGEFPVLIDIETLIQNDSPIKRSDNPFVKLATKKYSSVLGTALLPMKFYENRVEPLVEGAGRGIRLSAFDGSKQKSPYKALGIVNVNTDEVRFEYIEYEIGDSDNIPMLEGEEIDAEKYKREVIQGFDDSCRYFMANSGEIILMVEDIFADVIVRNVIKATQKYADMLGYGYHPQYMKNYVEREKLFENLWAFGYKNKSAIWYEIKDLLVDDVPIFYNNTSSKNLVTSDGSLLDDYYERTAIERIKERILIFDKQEYKYQKLRLELALGIHEQKTETINRGNSSEDVLHNIMRTICSRARYDKNKSVVTFEDFVDEPDGSLDYTSLNVDLYGGLSGIYLFVLYYANNYSNPEVENLKSALEKTLFRLPNKGEKDIQISAYSGKYSILYPLYHKYKLECNSEDLLLAENLLINLKNEVKQNVLADWVGGVSGLIQVLVNYYKLTGKHYFLEKAELLADNLDKKEIKLCGFAHGFSGIIYSLYSLYCETEKPEYLSMVKKCLNEENKSFDGKVWMDLREGKNTISQWCHGTVGIGLTRLYLLESGFDNEQIRQDLHCCLSDVLVVQVEESGICHGNMGHFLFLREIKQSQFLPEIFKEEVDRKLSMIIQGMMDNGIVVDSFDGQSVLGLMTGITGVGYGILKELNQNIPNILCLE